ncbi:MAG: hypothetical protein NC350_00425 [Corallococcus sp.]|nr:hypothetical protein [Corallococcus sp.]
MAQKSLSYKQYRAADLLIFAVILCALEAIITVAAKKWFPEQPFVVTLVYTIVALVTMRWGAWGVMHAVLGGLTLAVASGASVSQYVIYAAGNAFCALSILYTHFVGREKIRSKVILTILHVAIVYLSIILGRATVAAIYGNSFVDVFVMFVTTDALSLAITLVIVLIARRQNGLYENQKQFLLRTEKERMKELRQSQVDEDTFGSSFYGNANIAQAAEQPQLNGTDGSEEDMCAEQSALGTDGEVLLGGTADEESQPDVGEQPLGSDKE